MTTAPKKHLFSIQSDPKNLQPLLKDSLAPLLTNSGFEGKVRDTLLVALGEAITNCMRHSYQGQKDQPIEITVEDAGDKITFRIRDYGQAVDLERIKAKSSPKLPPENPGGLGVYFIKTIMDDMEYNTTHAKGNELILVKRK